MVSDIFIWQKGNTENGNTSISSLLTFLPFYFMLSFCKISFWAPFLFYKKPRQSSSFLFYGINWSQSRSLQNSREAARMRRWAWGKTNRTESYGIPVRGTTPEKKQFNKMSKSRDFKLIVTNLSEHVACKKTPKNFTKMTWPIKFRIHFRLKHLVVGAPVSHPS